MTKREYKLYMKADAGYDDWTIPVAWVGNLMGKCIDEERVSDSTGQRMLDVLDSYRNSFRTLALYDWISVPLVYTQVVTLATFGYFILCLIGRQVLEDHDPPRAGREIDMKFPFFTTLEFLFYIGWLKVAEELNFPFGEDDEDFAMNYFVDRYFRMSYMIVDDLTKHEVKLVRDQHWDERRPNLPHTIASSSIEGCDEEPRWRLDNYKINEKEHHWILQNPKGIANKNSAETKVLLADLNDV